MVQRKFENGEKVRDQEGNIGTVEGFAYHEGVENQYLFKQWLATNAIYTTKWVKESEIVRCL